MVESSIQLNEEVLESRRVIPSSLGSWSVILTSNSQTSNPPLMKRLCVPIVSNETFQICIVVRHTIQHYMSKINEP